MASQFLPLFCWILFKYSIVTTITITATTTATIIAIVMAAFPLK